MAQPTHSVKIDGKDEYSIEDILDAKIYYYKLQYHVQ
jgi:hypothetical protein